MMKLHEVLSESIWTNKSNCLNVLGQIYHPKNALGCFFSVEGLLIKLHTNDLYELTLEGIKLKAYLDLYAISHFNLSWRNYERTPGRTFKEVHSILKELDI